jgi:hypothetical protein
MAAGFDSINPRSEAKLRALGLPSEAVTQGFGYAAASAGFHSPVGTIDGHEWSPCIDLSPEYVSYNREWLSRLVDAGIAPFARNAENGWSGAEHWHCIDVELGHLLSGVEAQVHDFCNGRNGLAGHATFDGPLAPDASMQQSIREVYLNGDPRTPVKILDTQGGVIDCYGFMEDGTTMIEVRPWVEHIGGTITGPTTYQLGGMSVDFSSAEPYVCGEFTRARIGTNAGRAGMAQLAGLLIAFSMQDNAATVQLSRAHKSGPPWIDPVTGEVAS